MNYKEYKNSQQLIQRLKNEIKTIPDELVLERGNLEWLLYQEEEKLASIEQPPEPIKNLIMTFKGKAVNGTESINAKFISNVSLIFADIINFFNRDFNEKDGSQLIIKGVVRGSFGFEFESQNGLQLQLFESNTEKSLEKFQEYLSHFINDNDDDLDGFLVDSNPTLLAKLKNFFTVNSKYESWFVSNFAGDKLDTKSKEIIDSIISRISIPSEEYEIILDGHFHGCLPSVRKIDFISEEESYSIKLGSSIQLEQIEEILNNVNSFAQLKISNSQTNNALT